MDKCQVKKGMFVLSTCDSPSSIRCDDCTISICADHSQQSGPKVLCPDCFNRAHPEVFNPNAKTRQRHLDDNYYRNYNMWYFATRSHFYGHSNYRPFNEDDYRVFDKKDDMDLKDDNESGSFFDS
jgi:hypothetical protein